MITLPQYQEMQRKKALEDGQRILAQLTPDQRACWKCNATVPDPLPADWSISAEGNTVIDGELVRIALIECPAHPHPDCHAHEHPSEYDRRNLFTRADWLAFMGRETMKGGISDALQSEEQRAS